MAWASPRNPGPLQRAGSGRLGPRASGGVLPAAHPASAAQTFPAGDAWPPQERGTKLALRPPAAPRREGEGREGSTGGRMLPGKGRAGRAGGQPRPAHSGAAHSTLLTDPSAASSARQVQGVFGEGTGQETQGFTEKEKNREKSP